MDNNPFSMNWADNWSNLQKKMWNDWSALAQQSTPNAAVNPFNFFQQSMEESNDPMWAAFSPFQVKSPEEMARQSMMGAMNNFMNMSKGVFDTFGKMGKQGEQSIEEWTAELDKNLTKFREYFTSGAQSDFNALNPLSAWSNMLENVPGFSSDMMKQFMGQAGQINQFPGLSGESTVEKFFNDTLNMPGLGLNREKQEKLQKAIQLGIVYQKVMVEYQTIMNKSSAHAAELFRDRLVSMAQAGDSIKSLRDLHVMWVDCSEESNAKTVASPEYQEINPRLTNALLTLQKHLQSMTDDNMAALNMPTRKELNSAYLQIHDLKKKVRKLEGQLKNQTKLGDSTEFNRLRDDLEKLDIDSLRADIEALKKQSTSAIKPAAKAAAKPAAKKSTTTQKAASKTKATAAKAKTADKPATKKGA
ncbi:MAG: class III poly(R)-hydroxyalkanoic acid synthase subunit PhaE [Magnetococcales bacterium]|nr:class III poly(R)-hydroxyalkanoic acid synthase subunit PhaE [Magnetococcales bacterium]